MRTFNCIKNPKLNTKSSAKVALIGLFITLVGCNNPCQQLCDEIASYAIECGYSVTDDQIDQCIDDNASGEVREGTTDVCYEYKDELRADWPCDDVAVYLPE